jgi:hypothetical protein
LKLTKKIGTLSRMLDIDRMGDGRKPLGMPSNDSRRAAEAFFRLPSPVLGLAHGALYGLLRGLQINQDRQGGASRFYCDTGR